MSAPDFEAEARSWLDEVRGWAAEWSLEDMARPPVRVHPMWLARLLRETYAAGQRRADSAGFCDAEHDQRVAPGRSR